MHKVLSSLWATKTLCYFASNRCFCAIPSLGSYLNDGASGNNNKTTKKIRIRHPLGAELHVVRAQGMFNAHGRNFQDVSACLVT